MTNMPLLIRSEEDVSWLRTGDRVYLGSELAIVRKTDYNGLELVNLTMHGRIQVHQIRSYFVANGRIVPIKHSRRVIPSK